MTTAVKPPEVIAQPTSTGSFEAQTGVPRLSAVGTEALGNLATPDASKVLRTPETPQAVAEQAAALAGIHRRVANRREVLGQNERGREVVMLSYPNDHLTVLTTGGQNQTTMHSIHSANPKNVYTGPAQDTPAERAHREELEIQRRARLKLVK